LFGSGWPRPAAWLASFRDGARANGILAGRAASAALVASLPGVPEAMRRGAASDAGRTAALLCSNAIYSGDAARMDADMRFYRDGFVLLQRDVRRDGPLLFAPGPLTERQVANAACRTQRHALPLHAHVLRLVGACRYRLRIRAECAMRLRRRQQAARARISEDLRALLPFSLLLMNTFPLTHAMVEPVVKPRGWLPRRWLLPSSFETERLRSVQRARRVAAAAAAAADAPAAAPPETE
jgi:hypothetical protein